MTGLGEAIQTGFERNVSQVAAAAEEAAAKAKEVEAKKADKCRFTPCPEDLCPDGSSRA